MFTGFFVFWKHQIIHFFGSSKESTQHEKAREEQGIKSKEQIVSQLVPAK